MHSKPQSLGSGNSIFPLPLSSRIIEGSTSPLMVRATCRALNLLYGVADEPGKQRVSAAGEEALKFVCRCVDGMGNWSEVFPVITFDIFFRSKGVDYRGEEVKVAQRFSWGSISPALPPEVGGVSLVDFSTLGTKHYILNFPEFLVPEEKRFLGKPPSVMVNKEDWFDVCRGLVDCGVCGIIPLEDVCHIHGRPLLGGLFGIGKNEFVGEVETPGIAGLSPFMLGDGEVALVSSEDIRCFFYLFGLPSCWYPFLGFNKEVPPQLVPPRFQGKTCVLHSKVLPMGFRNSVGIAQHVHRNVINSAFKNASPAIGGQHEMRKDKPATASASSYRIYLDNFDVICKTDPQTAEIVKGTPGLFSLLARQAYSEANLPRHPKKATCQETCAEVQAELEALPSRSPKK